MRAVDTNVIVRFLVRDDADQAERARAILVAERVFVPLTVIVETEWVLRSVYGFASSVILETLERFCGASNIKVGEEEALKRAFGFARGGLDLTDAVHVAQCGDCDAFLTFDKRFVTRARKSAGAKVVLV